MGAYLLQLDTKCSYGGCSRRACVEVFDTFNGSRGRFCQRHGKVRLLELQRIEAKATDAVVAERRS